ncbi:hypothetical protein [Lentzea cavernae]|uniref:Uncharacterized protein n=1 Tax=Lentzea cavernae TaxID=2020703 RepID=A0ABQ3MH17_9PSEU|nr:hypothetical protein [Lentzea cavernae]GHH41803.1 hypothetical protein GCM10017774_37000 [Lentzea cavernae]
MPFDPGEVRVDLMCRPGSGVIAISVQPCALRRLGLHPEQPSSQVTGASPPAWWHAEAERRGY